MSGIENDKNIKIVLGGLDNAGKSSMLIVIQKLYDFEKQVNNLKPTIRVKYHQLQVFGHQLNFVDLGGQEKYRSLFVNNPVYFSDTDFLYFILDIQDEKNSGKGKYV